MTTIKRSVKDTLFTDLFSDPKYLFQLYQSLHPEDQPDLPGIRPLALIVVPLQLREGRSGGEDAEVPKNGGKIADLKLQHIPENTVRICIPRL